MNVSVPVPSSFVEFMRAVVDQLKPGPARISEEELDSDHGFSCAQGHGGRFDGRHVYLFTFRPDLGREWAVELTHHEIDEIARGAKVEMVVRDSADVSAAIPDSVGKRFLDALLAEELIQIRQDRYAALAVALGQAAFEVLGSVLDDVGRGATLACQLEQVTGVEDFFASDEDLIRVLRRVAGPVGADTF